MAKSSRKDPIQVKPPLTDAIPPFLEARQMYKLDKVREQRMLETLGAAIYESRQKKSPKVPVLLTSLPKGYYAEYKSYYRFAGHPSNIRFNSTNAFLIHLLWLEDMSHPSSIRPRRICSCVVCEEHRDHQSLPCQRQLKQSEPRQTQRNQRDQLNQPHQNQFPENQRQMTQRRLKCIPLKES
ncbi:hypothetical protein PS15p_205867 [Mucor circinelloides]